MSNEYDIHHAPVPTRLPLRASTFLNLQTVELTPDTVQRALEALVRVHTTSTTQYHKKPRIWLIFVIIFNFVLQYNLWLYDDDSQNQPFYF